MSSSSRFVFRVGPHAIEDLGSNLYTSFPRVLAEFVANAYDADATEVSISVNFKKIAEMRRLMRRHHERNIADRAAGSTLPPLIQQFLPDSLFIEIRDDGFGMSEPDLKDRFLWTARRRRELPPLNRAKASRPLMGRKGLGKLAGFGVARVMEVITKQANCPRALKIVLDYDEILKYENLTDVPIPGGEVTDEFSSHEQGTIIRLRKLAFDAVKSRASTVAREISEHFEFIEPSDFRIKLNDHTIPPPRRRFAYAWPEPSASDQELIKHELETDQGKIRFEYRLRFRGDRQALPAERRGVRVYVSNRMASAPSLFESDTNMHGFRMTDYLDGVVAADFIDKQVQDYISTDRQSLRWDTPLLSPLREFISSEIKEACKQYQGQRDSTKVNEVLADSFTQRVLESQPLSARERSLLEKLAVNLARISKKGVEDEKYRQLLPDIVRSFGQGNLYQRLSEFATNDQPDVRELLVQVVRLNRLEIDRNSSIIKSRLKAIAAL